MLLFANIDTQDLVDQPRSTSPRGPIIHPRASAVPVVVQFIKDGSVIDPEARIASITSAARGTNVTFLSPAHGFSAADVVTLAGLTGAAKTIVSSTAATPAVITVTSHGYANGQTITIVGHSSIPDGSYVVAGVTTHTFTVGYDTTSTGAGGTVTAALPNPDINGSQTIASVTTDTFTINSLSLLSEVAGGTATNLIDLDLRWTVKENLKFDGDSVASIAPGDFVKSGSGSTTKFSGFCNYITAELNTLLGVDPPTTANDEEEVNLMAELLWEGAYPGKTNWIVNTLRNDLYKTGEADPVTTGGEDNKVAIGNGVSTLNVDFDAPLASANWHFLGTPFVTNTTDATPLAIFVTGLTARSATGFTVALSGVTDSANYVLEFQARLD